jgi:hypothetical protein
LNLILAEDNLLGADAGAGEDFEAKIHARGTSEQTLSVAVVAVGGGTNALDNHD